jgi:hypothetical protein
MLHECLLITTHGTYCRNGFMREFATLTTKADIQQVDPEFTQIYKPLDIADF